MKKTSKGFDGLDAAAPFRNSVAKERYASKALKAPKITTSDWLITPSMKSVTLMVTDGYARIFGCKSGEYYTPVKSLSLGRIIGRKEPVNKVYDRRWLGHCFGFESSRQGRHVMAIQGNQSDYTTWRESICSAQRQLCNFNIALRYLSTDPKH